MRILSLATLPLDFPGGSQLLVREQAAALCEAGAEVTTCSHASCDGGIEASFEQIEIAKGLSPRRYRPGIYPSRIMVDLAQAPLLWRVIEDRRPDVILAHHVEAGLLARGAVVSRKVPVVYVAHTSMADELPDFFPAFPVSLCRWIGGMLDRRVAQRADGVITISSGGFRLFSRICASPVSKVLPGFRPLQPPDEAALAEILRRYRLSSQRHVVYAGGLARFQNTGLLARIAARLDTPILMVTHDSPTDTPEGVRVIRTRSYEESRLVLWACGLVGLVPRRRAAGFPMKVLTYLEAGLPIVAARGALDGYCDNHFVVGVEENQGVEPFVNAINRFLATGFARSQWTTGSRAFLCKHHDRGEQARATLAFLDRVIDFRSHIASEGAVQLQSATRQIAYQGRRRK